MNLYLRRPMVKIVDELKPYPWRFILHPSSFILSLIPAMPLSQIPVGATRHDRRQNRHAPPKPLAKPVSGVLFDMCNILYDDTVWRRWVLRLLARLGLSTNYCSFFRLWDREYLEDVHRGRRDFRQAFASFLQCAGLTSGQIDEVEAASHARRRYLESHSRPLPGVRNTLWRLHQKGLAFGVLCNSEYDAAALCKQLNRFGIEKFFTTVVSSIDMNCCMPEPAPYLAALEKMALTAEKAVFVGHDRLELAGAAAVGMSTVAFNFDHDAQADVHINRFEDLLEVLIPAQAHS
jgi:FMN phosphatase YigB (HAD superfamily)